MIVFDDMESDDCWEIAEDEDIDTTLIARSTARAVTDRFGPEDPNEWGPGVDVDSKNE